MTYTYVYIPHVKVTKNRVRIWEKGGKQHDGTSTLNDHTLEIIGHGG